MRKRKSERKKTGRQEKFCFCVSKTCFKWFRCLRCKTHRRRLRFRALNKSVDDVAVVVVVVDVVSFVAVVTVVVVFLVVAVNYKL